MVWNRMLKYDWCSRTRLKKFFYFVYRPTPLPTPLISKTDLIPNVSIITYLPKPTSKGNIKKPTERVHNQEFNKSKDVDIFQIISGW